MKTPRVSMINKANLKGKEMLMDDEDLPF